MSQKVAMAVSWTLAGGVFAPFLGPLLAIVTRDLGDWELAGNFLPLFALYLFMFVILFLVDFRGAEAEKASENVGLEEEKVRPFRGIVFNFDYMVAVMTQAVSFGSMAALMSGTPVAMRAEGISFDLITAAIVSHLLGMYLPSFITSDLVRIFGSSTMALAGLVILIGGALFFLIEREAWIFIVAITIVGVGWNFAFIPSFARLGPLLRDNETKGPCFQ